MLEIIQRDMNLIWTLPIHQFMRRRFSVIVRNYYLFCCCRSCGFCYMSGILTGIIESLLMNW
jgi:hypothetical protein